MSVEREKLLEPETVEIPGPLSADAEVEINMPDDKADPTTWPVLEGATMGVDFGAAGIVDAPGSFAGIDRGVHDEASAPIADTNDYAGLAEFDRDPPQPPMLEPREPDLVFVKKDATPQELAAAGLFAHATGTKVAVRGEPRPEVEKVQRTLIRGMAVPVEWVRGCADPVCEICLGDGFIEESGKRERFCRCAIIRAEQRIVALENSERMRRFDPPPPDQIPVHEEAAKRRDRQIASLSEQLSEAEAALRARDDKHALAISGLGAAEADRRTRLREDANRAQAGLQDAAAAEVIAKEQRRTLRERLEEAEAEVLRARSAHAAAEAKHETTLEALQVASGLAEESERRALDLTTDLEQRIEVAQRRHQRDTDGARRAVQKLRRRLAVAEARR